MAAHDALLILAVKDGRDSDAELPGRHLLPLIVSCNQVRAPSAIHEREVLKLDNLVVQQVNRVKLVLLSKKEQRQL